MKMFNFGNPVVDKSGLVGVVVKVWSDGTYDVYIRDYSNIAAYDEKDLSHYGYGREIKKGGEVIY